MLGHQREDDVVVIPGMLRVTHCLAKATVHYRYFCTTMRLKFVIQLDIVELNIKFVLGIVKSHVNS